jgi:hypothetical protein
LQTLESVRDSGGRALGIGHLEARPPVTSAIC